MFGEMKRYKTALILGFGVSGFAAAKLLLSEGCRVIIFDRNDSEDMRDRAARLPADNLDIYFGAVSIGDIFSKVVAGRFVMEIPAEICIISPGIACNDPWVKLVKSSKIKVVSELELGASRLKVPMIAVTGSNGKSTFVKLCGDMLEQNGIKAVLCGNYGKPVCEAALEQHGKYDWAVVEVSSFQLENIVNFSPEIAVLLNIEPDHLDRHRNMKTYKALKSKIFNRMTDDKLALVHDEIITDVQKLSSGSPVWKSFGCSKDSDYYYHNGVIKKKNLQKGIELDLRQTIFANEITGLTAAAVFAVSEYLALDIDNTKNALMNYKPLPHRMQVVGEIDGVIFVDDSKATNIAALTAALEMTSCPIRLIVGGQLKEKDISKPQKLLKNSVDAVYCIGESSITFKKEWDKFSHCFLCGDLETAVNRAFKHSKSGDVILLSPGCASFDQFCSYKDRGVQFQRVVSEIDSSK